MLVDDMGYSDIGCFGSEIPTPHLDRLAEQGLRYSNFHTTPKCSPTRACLMTGYNHHLAGYADVVHFDPGFPAYRMQLDPAMPTMAQRLRDQGYATLMIGKWHLAKESEMSSDGPRDSWPLQRGFDEFYGFLDGFTTMHEPHRLVEGNSILSIDSFPPDYYLTDDLTDRAIRMIREHKTANSSRPFFLYFAHAAVHAPLHARTADILSQRGRYQAGWDVVRKQRFARQLDLGIVEKSTVLPDTVEPGFEIPAWDELADTERAVFARYMEVYAAVVSNLDENFGRLRESLEAMGEWDNTIVLFLSDNGASSEGGRTGSPCYFNVPGVAGGQPSQELRRLRSIEFAYSVIDRIGLGDTMPHYPQGWARVSNTPFRLFKRQTHAGGHQVPAILSWPRRIDSPGQVRRQYVHVVDVLPTVLDLVGCLRDEDRQLDGTSFVASIVNGDHPGHRSSQYYEMDGSRGYYQGGWEVVARYDPTGQYRDTDWELYHLQTDPTEITDLARELPGRQQELAAAWERAAWDNQVFPLSDASGLDEILRPATELAYVQPTTIWPGTPTLDRYRSRLLVQLRSFEVQVDLLDGYRREDEGVLVAHGDQGGGYLFYIEGGDLWYGHTFAGLTRLARVGTMSEGAAGLTARFDAMPNAQWAVSVLTDDRVHPVAGLFDMLWGVAPFQGIDVGIDRRSPVSWDLRRRRGTFAYSGRIEAVHYRPGSLSPDSPFARSADEARDAFIAMQASHD